MNSQKIVENFIDALQHQDGDRLSSILDSSVSIVLPMTFSGSPTPELQFDGKQAALGYIQQVFTQMAKIEFNDRQFSITDDEKTVFLEAIGDFVTSTDLPYKNVYVLKFELQESKIFRITEYANPVPYAVTFGLELGKSN